MAKKVTVKWLGQPQAHDYPAALSYLKLGRAEVPLCPD
jgi:hypothetical protein